MEDLLIFFRWFFPAMWQFFKIPFPLLGMTVGQVLIASSAVVFSFSLLGMLLRVSIGSMNTGASGFFKHDPNVTVTTSKGIEFDHYY